MRYGENVKGWWIDGCYAGFLKYNDDLLALYANAIWKGNPKALVAMNNGVRPYFAKHYSGDDFTCGEFNDFIAIPSDRFINGAQAFALIPLGVSKDGSEWGRWSQPGWCWSPHPSGSDSNAGSPFRALLRIRTGRSD